VAASWQKRGFSRRLSGIRVGSPVSCAMVAFQNCRTSSYWAADNTARRRQRGSGNPRGLLGRLTGRRWRSCGRGGLEPRSPRGSFVRERTSELVSRLNAGRKTHLPQQTASPTSVKQVASLRFENTSHTACLTDNSWNIYARHDQAV
jgi:hypothetical protein